MLFGNEFDRKCGVFLKMPYGFTIFEKYDDNIIYLKFGNEAFFSLFQFDIKDNIINLLPKEIIEMIEDAIKSNSHNNHTIFDKNLGKYLNIKCYQNDINQCVCLFEDVTEHYNLIKDTKVNVQKYRMAIENTNDIIFDYNPFDRTLKYTKNNNGFLNLQKIVKDIPNKLMEEELVHPDDFLIFKKMFDKILTTEKSSAVIRIKDDSGHYIWNKIILNRSNDEEHYNIIGLIKNIDEKMRSELSMKLKAESDGLTGLYNKKATETIIKNCISNDEAKKQTHAMLIIDIDNFKEVNDFLGHVYGDSLLLEISNRIKSVFRKDDIIGRIGGDEFMVFMKDIKKVNSIKQKVNKISTLLKDKYFDSQVDINITTSIGIAVYPDSGKDFLSLYKNADVALYKSKEKGKDRYNIFDPSEIVDVNKPLKIDLESIVLRKNFALNVADHVLRILYGNDNVEETINSVLKLLTNTYKFTRASIYEIINDSFVLINKYNDNGISMFNSKHIPSVTCSNFIMHLTEGEGYFVDDLSKAEVVIQKMFKKQSVKSMYLFSIKSKNQLKGFIVLDNSDKKVNLKKEEIHELSIISNILSLYMLKNKMTHVLEQKLLVL